MYGQSQVAFTLRGDTDLAQQFISQARTVISARISVLNDLGLTSFGDRVDLAEGVTVFWTGYKLPIGGFAITAVIEAEGEALPPIEIPPQFIFGCVPTNETQRSGIDSDEFFLLGQSETSRRWFTSQLNYTPTSIGACTEWIGPDRTLAWYGPPDRYVWKDYPNALDNSFGSIRFQGTGTSRDIERNVGPSSWQTHYQPLIYENGVFVGRIPRSPETNDNIYTAGCALITNSGNGEVWLVAIAFERLSPNNWQRWHAWAIPDGVDWLVAGNWSYLGAEGVGVGRTNEARWSDPWFFNSSGTVALHSEEIDVPEGIPDHQFWRCTFSFPSGAPGIAPEAVFAFDSTTTVLDHRDFDFFSDAEVQAQISGQTNSNDSWDLLPGNNPADEPTTFHDQNWTHTENYRGSISSVTTGNSSYVADVFRTDDDPNNISRVSSETFTVSGHSDVETILLYDLRWPDVYILAKERRGSYSYSWSYATTEQGVTPYDVTYNFSGYTRTGDLVLRIRGNDILIATATDTIPAVSGTENIPTPAVPGDWLALGWKQSPYWQYKWDGTRLTNTSSSPSFGLFDMFGEMRVTANKWFYCLALFSNYGGTPPGGETWPYSDRVNGFLYRINEGDIKAITGNTAGDDATRNFWNMVTLDGRA